MLLLFDGEYPSLMKVVFIVDGTLIGLRYEPVWYDES
jgi:hypothetical protein